MSEPEKSEWVHLGKVRMAVVVLIMVLMMLFVITRSGDDLCETECLRVKAYQTAEACRWACSHRR